MENTYEVNDIVNFDGNFYEVEDVKKEKVVLTHFDGPRFELETEYIQLVCKACNRLDLKK